MTDNTGHGTAVAGIIGAQGNNSIGVSGVCWNVRLVSLKVKNDTDTVRTDDIVEAINYAQEKGIKILNMSVGANHTLALENAISNYDGLLVCSAGNDSCNIDANMMYTYYPSSYTSSNIISVGASTPSDTKKSNSNYGSTSVDLFAPGENILSTYPIALCNAGTCGYDHTAEGAFSEGYHYFQNTSAATPFVAGVAALILSQDPNYSTSFLKLMIEGNVDEIAAFEGLCAWGGRLNAYESVHLNHSYNDSCSQYDSSNHKAYCACGEYVLQSHTYTKRYTPFNTQNHKAYCKCGAYTSQTHSIGNPNSSGVATCTKCGYGVQLWGDKPETETE